MKPTPTDSDRATGSKRSSTSIDILRGPRRDNRREKGRLYVLVQSEAFEAVVGAMIVLQAVMMALELQYRGFSLAEDTGHASADGRSEAVWPHARQVFRAFYLVFGVLYSLEILIKIAALRFDFAKDPWNWLDTSVVVVWVLSEYADFDLDAQILRLLRLARSLRLLRLLKIMNENLSDSLFLIHTALSASLVTTAWIFMFLLVIHSFCAVLLATALHEFYFSSDPDAAAKQTEAFEYFGSFSRCFLSILEISLGNWGVIVRVLMEETHHAFIIYGVVHKMTLGFAVIAVLSAVFIQETMRAAAMDDNLMVRQANRQRQVHANKMRKLFLGADASGNGLIDKDEWLTVCEDEWVRTWLIAHDIRPAVVKSLFELIDENGNGEITAEELINGTAALKGTSAAIKTMQLVHQVQRSVDNIWSHALFEQPAVAAERT